MFYFYSTQQTTSNVSYHKGILFEGLLREFLRALSYNVDDLRRKQNSLEYDIHGEHILDNRGLIAEAKAYEETVSGHHVAAFIGKALPHLCSTKRSYSALFLSTSSLSPDGEDYLRGLEKDTPYKVIHICGADLQTKIREQLKLPQFDAVTTLSKNQIPFQSGQHLLHTDRGTFVVVLGSGEHSVLDDRFCLIDINGKMVEEPEFLNKIKQSIQSFQELTVVCANQSVTQHLADIPGRYIPQSLITASDWFDYRKPASPQFFIGRQELIHKAHEKLHGTARGVVIEIKSRSGVGKSSLLATLERDWIAEGNRIELHDARDVQSVNDVLSLIQRFTKSESKITTFEQVPDSLNALEAGLGGKYGIIMVDQFESTFPAPEVFYAYEFLALCIVKASGNLAMIFTRKDDLLTTHDENRISLDRIRGVSETISLDDFSRVEALSLINQIAQAYPKRLSPQILSQVLAFGQGFPWLLKRTMSHVVDMISSGINQQELLSSGLHLEDLFEEELSELDQQERGYLTRLAGVLPATYQALAIHFEDDPFLRGMLEKLTSRRLLRFSAGTYDTYNDVFKDFLLYERLPERAESQIFRIGIGPVMQAFRSLKGQNKINPDEFGQVLGRKSRGGIYNTLRELRIAGLIVKSASDWSVPDVVRHYEHQGRLGEFVRQSVLKNRIVSEFIGQLEHKGQISKQDVPRILKQHFLFVDAKNSVWDGYARTFLDWLYKLHLVDLTDSQVLPAHEDKEEIVQKLGNLNCSGRSPIISKEVFIPTRSWGVAARVLQKAQKTPLEPADLTSSDNSAVYDLMKLGALKRESSVYVPQLSMEELESKVEAMFAREPYTEYWKLLREGVVWEDALAEAFSLNKLSKSVRRDYGRKLASWGRKLGFLSSDRLRAKTKDIEPSLFDFEG